MKLDDLYHHGDRAAPTLTLRSGIPATLRPLPFWRAMIKLNMRALANRAVSARWLALLNSHPVFPELVQHCPKLVQKIYRPYLSTALDIEQRLAMLAAHYRLLFARGLAPLLTAASRAGVQLASMEGKYGGACDIVLRAVGPMEREGELVLELLHDGALVYSIAFTFSGNGQVSVGCIQGPKGPDGLDRIREATRSLHGLRPKQLLVTLVQHLGFALGCTELRLVSNANRAVHRSMRQGRVLADYDQLWTELGARPRADGDFQLDCRAVPPPDLESIASKKRSEARKRHQSVVALADAVARRFRPPGESG